jgi:hypothetical protein
MNDITEMFEADTGNKEVLPSDLGGIALTAKKIVDAENAVTAIEQQLKDAKRLLHKLTDEDLPAQMVELGLSKFTLDDGSEVNVKQTYGASIPVDRRPEAYAWLRDNGFDDIIKNTVSCKFGRGQDDDAEKFMHMAASSGYVAEQKTEIHPMTLRSFVKERVESGDGFPMDMFGAYVGQRATIKRGK